MLEEFKEDEIIKKAGGRFRLTTLLQKRMVALNRGTPPLVDLPTKNLLEIAVREIMEGKIYLDDSGNVAITSDGSPTEADDFGDGGPSEIDV